MTERLCVLCKHWHIEESDEDYYCPSMPWIECKAGEIFTTEVRNGRLSKLSTIRNPDLSDIRRVAENCGEFECDESLLKLI